ncbi:hypothetical protein QJS04_geneDACA015553 [Acorus gramineus]|uniref:Myb-like domain-containing protein n=1 Tax=Acorus gramineus TaxID=55184 RepID=A0AAV9APA3_ACOGR|nr:hypothetical protein QJS04_geneDACA015553 [Acorus gramineus]
MAAGVNPPVKRAGGRQRAAAAGARAGVGGSGRSTVTEEVAVVKSSRPPTLIWTPEEQSLLEEGLTRYASVSKLSVRYKGGQEKEGRSESVKEKKSEEDNGGPTGQIFKHNMQAFSRVSANLSSLQTRPSEEMTLENIELLSQARENVLVLLSLQNDVNGVSPEIMMKMPPLPVKLNEEIANAILRKPNLPLFGHSSVVGGFNGGAGREENH